MDNFKQYCRKTQDEFERFRESVFHDKLVILKEGYIRLQRQVQRMNYAYLQNHIKFIQSQNKGHEETQTETDINEIG